MVFRGRFLAGVVFIGALSTAVGRGADLDPDAERGREMSLEDSGLSLSSRRRFWYGERGDELLNIVEVVLSSDMLTRRSGIGYLPR